ncbi:hypothetical protein HBI81_157330 [Parastagonospora nodorum]|nr:hypothetical protein HBI80_213100 [Parastagonospora nodorum]KAH5080150.1 hypothetical protein HBH95_080120 [Parastagonospora nodorum]KAH6520696.1 hypothetical protein HBI81_157330 [Parastagonospora nodorum]
MFKSLRKLEREISAPPNSNRLPEIVLFGDSLTEWSFDDSTQGFGLHLEKMYAGKARILNEGQAGYTSTRLSSDFDRIIQRATSPTTPRMLLFTIFLGANDACMIGTDAMVPWPTFSANIRAFIETILTQDGGLAETKIAVISPPPINGAEAKARGDESVEEIAESNEWKKEGPRYKTYMSKKRYAEGLMEIAAEYEETGRVIGVDYWRAMVEASGLGTWEEFEEKGMWPGCGLLGARSFDKGWFTDGLHLDVRGYSVLNELLVEKVLEKWPELGPGEL